MGISVGEFLPVNEVAPFPIAAVALFSESIAPLGFVASVAAPVNAQLIGAVRELAPLPVRTAALLSEVLAEGCLDFGGEDAERHPPRCLSGGVEFCFIPLCGGLGMCV